MRPARLTLPAAALAVLLCAGTLWSHDFFLRPDAFDVPAETAITVPALNGTFSRSENAVARDRLVALQVVRGGIRQDVERSAWDDRGDTSRVTVGSGAPGTLVIGVATAPRELSLSAKDFNEYLATDGVPDVLEARRRDGTLGVAVRERYRKAAKAFLRVGGATSPGWDAVLGHEAELVPLADPASARRGQVLAFRTLVGGEPVARQFVLAGGRRPDGSRIPVQRLRADSAGVVRVRLTHAGAWYVKFIRMTPAADGDSVQYESRWASATFGVR